MKTEKNTGKPKYNEPGTVAGRGENGEVIVELTKTGAISSRTEDHVRLDTRREPEETNNEIPANDDKPDKTRRIEREKKPVDRYTVHACICSCLSGSTQYNQA